MRPWALKTECVRVKGKRATALHVRAVRRKGWRAERAAAPSGEPPSSGPRGREGKGDACWASWAAGRGQEEKGRSGPSAG